MNLSQPMNSLKKYFVNLRWLLFIATSFAFLCNAQAQVKIIAGFYAPGNDDFSAEEDTTPDVFETGWTAKISNGKGFNNRTARNSTDGTFGSAAGAQDALGHVEIKDSDAFGARSIDFTLTNNTGADFDMDAATFSFDWNTLDLTNGSPTSFTVTYPKVASGDSLGNQNIEIGSKTITTTGYQNFDFALAGLFTQDSILSNGESVVFRISANNVTPEPVGRACVDNIAVWVPIPETSGYGLILGSITLGGILMYRKRKSKLSL